MSYEKLFSSTICFPLYWSCLFSSKNDSQGSFVVFRGNPILMVERTLPEGIEIHPTAIVCREATLEGSVRIGAGTVVHPFAVIKATNGPIIIGENNIIEDRSLIENILEEGDKLMEIGDQNIVEVGAVIYAPRIGNNNVLHVQCEVGPNSCVSNGCSVGVRCKLLVKETLPERTVIYGKWNERRVANDNPPVPQGQLEVLRRLLPSYHYLQKSKA